MTAPADRSCWSQFADDGTDFEPGTARGVVVLRYLGSRSCRISERPQLAVIDPQGHVVGPHAPPVVMNDEVSVRARQSIRFTIDVTATCGRPDGVYSVRIYLRPVAAPSANAGVGISLGEQRLARVPCPYARGLTAGSAGPMQVVGDETSRVLKALTGMARQEAADDGDAGASARAVRTTYGRVEHALFGRTPTGSVHNEVWVVELSGAHLAASMCAGDGNCPVSTGTHAVLVFQQPGLRYSDGKINSHSVTLSRLGTVFQLIP